MMFGALKSAEFMGGSLFPVMKGIETADFRALVLKSHKGSYEHLVLSICEAVCNPIYRLPPDVKFAGRAEEYMEKAFSERVMR